MAVERLSREDARILELESGPIAGHACKILIVEPREGQETLDLDALRASMLGGAQLVPRTLQKLAFTPYGLAPPLWVDDPEFDIAQHVVAAAEDVEFDDQAFRTLVGRLMSQRLDRSRPLWRLDVAGLTGGRTGLVWRIHHCMADGAAMMRMGSAMLWDSSPDSSPPEPRAPRHAPVPDRGELLRLGARDRLRSTQKAIAATGRMAVSAERWRGLVGARGLPATLRRELWPRRRSPFAGAIGRDREVTWVTTSLDALRRAGKGFGDRITINDAVLAVIAGGVRGWSVARGIAPAALRVKVPVSLHMPGEDAAALGNRDSFLVVDLPVGDPDPVRRLVAISRETFERKASHDAQRLDMFFGDLRNLPLGRRALGLAAHARVFAFNVSNVRGPAEPVFVLGRRVSGLHTLAEIAPGHALRVAVISAADRLSFGLCADPRLVPQLELLAAEIVRSVEELSLAAGGRESGLRRFATDGP